MVSEHDNCTGFDFNASRYCIPMNQIHHAVTVAEEKFFGECDTRNGDGFLLMEISILIGLGTSASCGAIHQMWCTYDTGISAWAPTISSRRLTEKVEGVQLRDFYQEKYMGWSVQNGISSTSICATGKFVICSHLHSILLIIFLDMNTFDIGCTILLEQTAAALNNKSLQMLLVSAQERNIMLCIEYAVK